MKRMYLCTLENLAEYTKRTADNVDEKTVNELVGTLKECQVFVQRTGLEALVYRDRFVSVGLKGDSKPFKLCPQLTFPLTDLALVRKPELVPVLSLVSSNCALVKNFTIHFESMLGDMPKVSFSFPWNLSGAATVEEFVRSAVGDKTWAFVIREIAQKQLHIEPNCLVLTHVVDGVSVPLYEHMRVSETTDKFFENEQFTPKGSFFYEVSLPFPFREYNTRAKEEDLFVREIIESIDSEGMINVMSIIARHIRSEIRTKEIERNTKNLELKYQVENALCKAMIGFTGKYFKKVNMTCTKWNDYVKWFEKISTAVHPCCTADDPGETPVNFVVGVALSMNRMLIDTMISYAEKVSIAFKNGINQVVDTGEEKQRKLSGTVVYSSFVKVGAHLQTLLLTRGFIQLVNFTPKVTDRCEILPEKYDISCSDCKITFFSAPLSDVVFFPLPTKPQKGLVISHETHFVVDFKNDDMYDFLAMFYVCKEEMGDGLIIPPRPKYGTCAIEFGVAGNKEGLSVCCPVKFLDNQWLVQLNYEEYLKMIEQLATEQDMCNLAMTNLPLMEPEYTGIVLGIAYTTEAFHKKLRLPSAKNVERKIAYGITLDICCHPDLEICFHSLAPFGISDFMKAFELNSIDMLRHQVQCFGKFIKSEKFVDTPLLHIMSMLSQNVGMVNELVGCCDPETMDQDGRSVLFYGMQNQTKAIEQLLFDEGIDINTSNDRNQSPLTIALEHGTHDIRDYLLTFSGRINARAPSCTSTIQYLIDTKNVAEFSRILPYLDESINCPAENGAYITHLLIDADLPEPLYALAKCPFFNPNKCSRQYPHPLHYMLSKGINSKEWMTAILSLVKLNLNARHATAKLKGQTPLTMAIYKGDINFTQALLSDHRCDIDMMNDAGETPIYLAVLSETPATVEALIKAGACVNAPNIDGQTALRKALDLAQPGSSKPDVINIIQLLLKAGASPNLWFYNGKLPVHVADGEIAKWMQAKQSKVPMPSFEKDPPKP